MRFIFIYLFTNHCKRITYVMYVAILIFFFIFMQQGLIDTYIEIREMGFKRGCLSKGAFQGNLTRNNARKSKVKIKTPKTPNV